jgi:hypothetical protein
MKEYEGKLLDYMQRMENDWTWFVNLKWEKIADGQTETEKPEQATT